MNSNLHKRALHRRRMAPRGLKATLKKSAPAKLVGAGKRRGFEVLRQGQRTNTKLKGLTKLLQRKVWSSGDLPLVARSSERRPGGHWGGPAGGRARGTRVDAQLTKLINGGPSAMKNVTHCYRLTKMALSGLSQRGLEPVCAQRAVISEKHRVGTAADIICYSKKENRIVVVELKCGFDHGRLAAAQKDGRCCKMAAPLSRVADCNVHRHLAQLAVTWELFCRERRTLKRLGELGIEESPIGLLMYVNDAGVEFFELEEWWCNRASKLLNAIA
tara:strand:+ start:5381 stop:6199 length:819 start_codon:yes stop_codon:yes gene_type:complete